MICPIKDTTSLEDWNKRNEQAKNSTKILTTPFHDDEPKLYAAYGVIKQVDSYEGSVVGVRKEKR